MKRKTLAFLLAACMLMLCACSQQPATTEPPVPPEGTQTPPEEPKTDGALTEKTPVEDGSSVQLVPGNSPSTKVKVEVSFADNKIAEVKVLEHGETQAILDTVTELFIPRVIEAQSLAVDAISGATGSSGAVRSAIALAIDELGGVSSEWYTPIEKKTDTVTLDGYDVIVVGLGGSGMTAYLAAAQGGATVFGIEVAGKIGGNSAVAGGPMTINPEARMESENNGEKFLDEEELIADWIETTRGDAKEDIIRLFVEESGYTTDWLIADFDFHFMPVMPFVHPKQWPVVSNYADENYEDDDLLDLYKTPMFTAAIEKAKALNDKNGYMLELRATDLIIENDEIVGVRATYYDGTTYEVYGDSVILATGGFIGNSEMKLQYLGSDLRTEAVLTEDGSGIQMALDAGAGTYNIDMPAIVHIGQVKNIIRTDDLSSEQKAILTSLAQKADTLIVGQSGKRYTNEASPFGVAFDNWKDGGFFYAIYTEDMLEQIKTEGLNMASNQMWFALPQGTTPVGVPIADLDTILQVGETYGNVVRADTLEELAEILGTPGLVETVAEYNSYAEGTPDPLGKPAEMIHAIGDGPYTAILGAGYYYGTCGGLDIDTNMQVLKTDGTPFDNLYAIGQESMGVLFTPQDAYSTYGGVAQGWTITSGRLAGAHAASKFAG